MRARYGFTYPSSNLGPTEGMGALSFNDWLMGQPIAIQNQVSEAQIANPSDYVPYNVSGSGAGIPNWVMGLGIALVGITLIKVGK